MGYRKRERRRRKIDTWKAKGSAITVSKDLSVLFANDVAFLFFFFFWHIPFCTCIVFLVFLLSISIGLLYSTYFVHLRYDNTTETVIFDCQGNTGKPGSVTPAERGAAGWVLAYNKCLLFENMKWYWVILCLDQIQDLQETKRTRSEASERHAVLVRWIDVYCRLHCLQVHEICVHPPSRNNKLIFQ